MGAIILIVIFLALIGPAWLASVVKIVAASLLCFFMVGVGAMWLLEMPKRMMALRRSNG